MPRASDPADLRLRRFLALEGPSSSAAILQHLGVSQATFSRLVARLRPELLVVGRARATRYAARRSISGVGERIPLYRVDAEGGASRIAWLHAIESRGFYVETQSDAIAGEFFDDLPYFLADLRPSGFLGRLIPRQHPDLAVPADIGLWSADHVLRYLTRFGSDMVGDLIVGDEAFQLHLLRASREPSAVSRRARARTYGAFANDILTFGPVGSSAAGEQPKFLTTRVPGPRHVLVKFSPPIDEVVGRRWGDILIAEHLANEILRGFGYPSAQTEVFEARGRIFLESERFDRVGALGRRGVISLAALDAQFGGEGSSWFDVGAALATIGLLDGAAAQEIAWIELFGRLIGNNDMHGGNLSFFTSGTRLLSVAPIYDMSPMTYAPRYGQVVADTGTVAPMAPRPRDAEHWASACRAAAELWGAVTTHALVSPAFRAIAERCRDRVMKAAALGALLPRQPGRKK